MYRVLNIATSYQDANRFAAESVTNLLIRFYNLWKDICALWWENPGQVVDYSNNFVVFLSALCHYYVNASKTDST
jgi:hypothetical protein